MGRRRIEGVQRQSDGRYRVRAEYLDEKTGKRAEIDRLVEAKDAAEAASIREKLLADRIAARGVRRPERTRLGDALDTWRKGKVLTLRGSTAERYDVAIAKWKGALGEYFLDRIDPNDVRGVLLGWRDNDRATETINGRLRVLRTFAKETRSGWIVEGVRALSASVAEVEEDEDEGRGLTHDELRALLEKGPTAAKTPKGKMPVWWPRAWALVATMAWTGLRFGEASALEWRDLDLDAGTLRVRRAQYRGIVGHPKARASKRTVVVVAELADVLRAHREAMLRGQLPGVESALVFPSRRTAAQYVSNTHARKTMLTVLAAAEIDLAKRPALHCLRHTMNNLVREHASEAVRRSLIGHTDEVETYTQIRVDEQRAAMGAVVQMIRGK